MIVRIAALLLLCAMPLSLSGEPAPVAPLPEGDGLAAKYPGDFNIDKDPAVVLVDGFERCEKSNDLRKIWNGAVWMETAQLLTDDEKNARTGKKALEFTLPQGSTHGHGVTCEFAKGHDLLFVRYYVKFDKDDDFFNSAHDGACLSAVAEKSLLSSPGKRADGKNKFMVSLDTWRVEEMKPLPPTPGEWLIYCYYPAQKGDYGDNFYPKQKFMVERNRWYCCELMCKANAAGQKDGRAAFWVDGKLIGDFTNLHFRDVESLKINHLTLTFYIGNNKLRSNRMWYDDVVVATSYIGPMVKERKAPARVETPKIEKPAPSAISAEVLASWSAKLVERVERGVKEGQRPTVHLKVMGQREDPVKIVGADAKNLSVEMQGNTLPMAWAKLGGGDRLNLARAFMKEDNADDLLLAAVFAQAEGRAELADELLSKAAAADPKSGSARVAEVRTALGLK